MDNSLDIFKIRTNNIAPRKGRVLIAEPFLSGNYFNRSVVLLVAFSEKGAVGFILNKKVDLQIQDVIPDFPEFDTEVFIGGPVATDSIYFIHRLGDRIPNSIHVIGDLYWGGDFDAVKKEIRLGTIDAGDIRFFLGYSGWDAGQLEEELKDDSWLVTDANQDAVLGEMTPDSWFSFVKLAGTRYSVWKNFPENPSMN
jgi:putative transcriptional regulator